MCKRSLSALHPELTCPAVLRAAITVKCRKVDSQNRFINQPLALCQLPRVALGLQSLRISSVIKQERMY